MFDYVSRDLLVLVCELEIPSYIVVVVRVRVEYTKDGRVERKDPIYHGCTFKDILVGPDFYLAFDSYSIDVFWNSQSQQFPGKTEHTREQVNFPGL